MTFATAKTEVAERLHDTVAANETRVGEWLNITMHEMCSMSNDWDWLRATADLAIVAGTQDYTISTAIASTCRNIVNIRLEVGGGSIMLPLNAGIADGIYPDPDQSTGRPESYSIWAPATLTIYPDPDANYTAKVKYIKTVADLATTETPPWPRYWDHVWLDGTEAIGLRFESLPRAETMRQQYEKGLRKMLAGKAIVLDQPIRQRGFSSRAGVYHGSPWPIERF